MTITGEEIIFRYCMGMLNPSPDYYAGRGNSVHDLNSSILEMLYAGIKTEIGADNAKMFVNMVKNLKNTNAQNFLLEYYRMEKKGWRWSEPVLKVRVASATDVPIPKKAEPEPDLTKAPSQQPKGRMTEILNAFTRSGSVFGHDKAITQTFLEKHKDEIDASLIASSFGNPAS